MASTGGDRLRQRVVDCCRELIRTPSPSGDEGAAARVAEAWLRRLGYDRVWVDRHGSVVGQIIGTAGAGPHLLLDGHLDTVPATNEHLWRHPPFAAEIDDGAVWGLGAADMKGPLAAMLCAAADVPRERLHGTVTVSCSVAEERLEGAALAAIVDALDEPARVDMVVIGEGTGHQVGVAQKGRAGITVTTTGRSAHSSTPGEGVNAVYAMVDAVARIRAVPLGDDPMLGPALMELTEIVSAPRPGSGMIPNRCTSTWDRRVVRGETAETVLAGLRDAVADVPGAEVAFESAALQSWTGSTLSLPASFHAAWETDPGCRLVEAALGAVAAAGGRAATRVLPYCTNGSVCAADRKLPTIILGPSDPALFHVVDEHITVADLERGRAIYAGLIERVLGD